MRTGHRILIVLGALAVLGLAPSSQAQLNSNTAVINLNAVRNPFLAVAAGPPLVNFALPPNGIGNGSTNVTIQTAWLFFPGFRVSCYAYFTNPAVALTSGVRDIPSSRVQGSVNGGAYQAFTGGSPFVAGGAVTLFTQTITFANFNSSRNDTLALRIDTTGLGLPAATYAGVLRIRAQII